MKKENVVKKKKKMGVADIIITIVLTIIALVCFIPFWHIVVCSFANPADIANSSFLLIPKSFTLTTIKYILQSEAIIRAMLVSVVITVVGTAASLGVSALMAYPLANKNLKFRRTIMFIIVLTMVFNPGMIPNFLNVRDLGLYNSSLALVVPGLIVTYNLILLKNYYQAIPESLSESAKIDGAHHFTIFAKIFLPLSKPILATVGLFYGVAYWNSYIAAVLYIDDSKKWPIQVLLRNIVLLAQTDLGSEAGSVAQAAIDLQSLRSATILISIIPMLCAYPFVQKYFTKGIMLGSVKG